MPFLYYRRDRVLRKVSVYFCRGVRESAFNDFRIKNLEDELMCFADFCISLDLDFVQNVLSDMGVRKKISRGVWA